jgi:hypothetical protein
MRFSIIDEAQMETIRKVGEHVISRFRNNV